ncbi:MAG: hypothetical protein AB7K86_13110 [Rhodospirillales bacterium]
MAAVVGGCALEPPMAGRTPEPDQPDAMIARAGEAPDFAPRGDGRVVPIPPIPLRKPTPPPTQSALRTPELAVSAAGLAAVPAAAPPESHDTREPPQLSPEMLVGLSEQETHQLLGQPNTVRREPPSTVWNYAAGDCSLDVYFYFDLSTSRFRSLAYELKTARRTDDAQQLCLGDIQTIHASR